MRGVPYVDTFCAWTPAKLPKVSLLYYCLSNTFLTQAEIFIVESLPIQPVPSSDRRRSVSEYDITSSPGRFRAAVLDSSWVDNDRRGVASFTQLTYPGRVICELTVTVQVPPVPAHSIHRRSFLMLGTAATLAAGIGLASWRRAPRSPARPLAQTATACTSRRSAVVTVRTE